MDRACCDREAQVKCQHQSINQSLFSFGGGNQYNDFCPSYTLHFAITYYVHGYNIKNGGISREL